MKKQYLALAGALLLSSLPAVAFSSSMVNSAAGAAIVITAPSGSGQDFRFQVSPNVKTAGATTASSFSIAAWNESTIGADGGEAYGMASELSGTYTLDLSDASAAPTVGTAGTTADFGTDWVAPSTTAGS